MAFGIATLDVVKAFTQNPAQLAYAQTIPIGPVWIVPNADPSTVNRHGSGSMMVYVLATRSSSVWNQKVDGSSDFQPQLPEVPTGTHNKDSNVECIWSVVVLRVIQNALVLTASALYSVVRANAYMPSGLFSVWMLRTALEIEALVLRRCEMVRNLSSSRRQTSSWVELNRNQGGMTRKREPCVSRLAHN